MKSFEYVYFNIYNYCNQRSYYSGNLTARFQAMYMLTLSAGGWALLLQAVYLRLIKKSWFASPEVAMGFSFSVYLIIGLLFHRIFIVNNHDEKILNKYEQAWNADPNKKRDLMLSIFAAVVPYVLLLSFSLIFPRQR